MKTVSEYIIEEGLKNKIKQLINKFIKLGKEGIQPDEITYDKNDYRKYNDKVLSDKDLDNCIRLIENTNDKLFEDSDKTKEYIKRIAFKQALIIYGYNNFKGFIKSKHDALDILETSQEEIYVILCDNFGYKPYTPEANHYAGTQLSSFYSGWWYAENLNIKYEKDIKLNFNETNK